MPAQAEVVGLYESGVAAVERITADFDHAAWASPACGEWSATTTAQHLVGVIDWYEAWLDRALTGVAAPPFAESEFTVRNQAGIEAHSDLGGPEAVQVFAERARAYVGRATAHWNAPYGFPAGIVTVGLHCGIAATEWHLHAWDLSAVSGRRHEPEQARLLMRSAGEAMAMAKGGVGGRLLGVVVPLASTRKPWRTLLKQSGR